MKRLQWLTDKTLPLMTDKTIRVSMLEQYDSENNLNQLKR